MYASTVGGGAMTLVFKPQVSGKDSKITAVKVPVKTVRAVNDGRKAGQA